MLKRPLALLLALVPAAAASAAGPSITFLPPGYLLTDLAEDGAGGCGNVQGDGSYETFRWNEEEGIVRLGRSTVNAIGVGGGSPDISHDGRRISASILSSDNRMTQGIWDQTTGWFEVFPPMPPDGVVSDSTYGSAWGLSGDGTTITGFYYSNWSGPTRARPSSWSTVSGLTALPSISGRSSRVNASNYDGTIVGGWEDHGGPWWPTVWRNGVKTNITDNGGGGGGQVYDVSRDGTYLAGAEYQESISTRAATIWTWDGSAYVMNNIGILPGTIQSSGQAYFSAISSDGTIAVGSNIYTLSPGADRAGIVWTPSGGLQNASDYIAGLGLAGTFTPSMVIREMTSVAPDGSAMTGIVLDTAGGYFQSFIITFPPPPCFGDADGNGAINFADVTAVLANFGATGAPFMLGDADGNGAVNFSDVTAVLASFNQPCP